MTPSDPLCPCVRTPAPRRGGKEHRREDAETPGRVARGREGAPRNPPLSPRLGRNACPAARPSAGTASDGGACHDSTASHGSTRPASRGWCRPRCQRTRRASMGSMAADPLQTIRYLRKHGSPLVMQSAGVAPPPWAASSKSRRRRGSAAPADRQHWGLPPIPQGRPDDLRPDGNPSVCP